MSLRQIVPDISGVESKSAVPSCEDRKKVKTGTAEQQQKRKRYKESSDRKMFRSALPYDQTVTRSMENVENYKRCYLFLLKLKTI